LRISIVIPTIGDRNLIQTINSLNNNTIRPDEIIICIPSKQSNEFQELKSINNVKIIRSKYKGQVKQRIEGFKFAKNEIIVQLDDDIILSKNCLERLLKVLKNKGKCAVSPNLFDIKEKKSIYDRKNGLKRKIFNLVSHGKINVKGGIITNSGFESYPIINQNDQNPISTSWLIGGCVMHFKKNLILKDYFKFQGKAYCEDLYHSVLLNKNGVRLFIDPSAKAYLNLERETIYDFLSNLKNDLRIRRKLVLSENLNVFRMYCIYAIIIIKRLIGGK